MTDSTPEDEFEFEMTASIQDGRVNVIIPIKEYGTITIDLSPDGFGPGREVLEAAMDSFSDLAQTAFTHLAEAIRAERGEA